MRLRSDGRGQSTGSSQDLKISFDQNAPGAVLRAFQSRNGNSGLLESLLRDVCQLLDGEFSLLYLLNDTFADLDLFPQLLDEPVRSYEVSRAEAGHLLETCILDQKSYRAASAGDGLHTLAPGNGLPTTLPVIPGASIRSVLCSPLVVGGQALGAIGILNRQSGEFLEEDERMLELLAEAVANLLHHFLTIQQLQIANAELQAVQWQLVRSRNVLRTLFDSIPTAIYIVDKKYNLVAVNEHRANRLGSHPKQLVGKRCYQALHGRSEACTDCKVIDTLYGGQGTNRKKREWREDGEVMEWEISTFPIQEEERQVTQAVVLEEDITEKHRLEATLMQSEKLAAVGQLAAGIAHEINNPLTAIVANAQMLHRELDPEDDRQELVDLISRAGERAAQVVRNLLDLARKERYEFNPTDVNDTVRRAIALLHHEIIRRSIRLAFEPADDLPRVRASADHLQGVWINLLTNAMDALDGQGSEIIITTRRQGNEVKVVVADTGKGIPPEKISRIFEPFYSTKAPGRGTGLGLSVCQRVINQHGGHIRVDSRDGQGTQFTVVLPVV